MTDRDSLILAHVPYAKRLAAKFCARHRIEGEAAAEIESVAVLGLCLAARRFDASLGVGFQTYSFRWVHGAMADFVKREVKMSRAMAEHGEDVVDQLGVRVWPITGEDGTAEIDLSYSRQQDGESLTLASELRRHVFALPKRQREAVLDRFFRDERLTDVADRLSVSKLTVHRRTKKALEQLRLRLKAA